MNKKFNYIINGKYVNKTFDSIQDLLLDAFEKPLNGLHYKYIFKTEEIKTEVYRDDVKINILAFIPGEGYCDCFDELHETLAKING